MRERPALQVVRYSKIINELIHTSGFEYCQHGAPVLITRTPLALDCPSTRSYPGEANVPNGAPPGAT